MATSITNQNLPLIHRKEFQMMTPAPVNSAAGSFIVTDQDEVDNLTLYMVNATTHYLYHHDEDAWIQVTSGALAGTFGPGSCGAAARWSSTLTSNGGSTTTVTTTTSISGLCLGRIIRFLSGANAGLESTVTAILTNPGGTNTIQFDALPNAVLTGVTFTIATRRYYIWNGGTAATGSFKNYDPLLGVWTTLNITGAPASVLTDGRLVSTPGKDIFASGTATSATTTTIVNTAKTWTVNQWCNYQIRISAGTGIGQVRTITSNTANTLTVPTWTITPDATSQYEIMGNDDFLYLLGNNAVTMYRYSISGNSWTTLAPTTARTGAPGVGMSANWVSKTGDTLWENESDIRDGRFIYSFRGAGGGLLDRYDISGGTAGAGAWLSINYINLFETFTTGTSYAADGRYIYIRKEATGRYFKYSVRGNYIEPLTTNMYPESTAVLGDKLWLRKYEEGSVTKLVWLYGIQNTSNVLHRILLY